MTPPRIVLLAVIVSSNNFAASLALGALGRAGAWPRILLAFAVAESAGTLTGLAIGRTLAQYVGAVGTIVAAAVLVAFGIWTASSAFRPDHDHELLARGSTTWPGVMVLGALMGIDNVAIGFGLGLGAEAPWTLALVVASSTVLFASLGLWLGRVAKDRFETHAVVGSGLALVAVGVALAVGWL